MPRTVVPQIVVRRVGRVEPLHEPAKVRFLRPQQKVEVIAHQHIAMHLHLVLLDALFERFQEPHPVLIVPEYLPPLVPAARDVVPRTRIFDPQWPGHIPIIPPPPL